MNDRRSSGSWRVYRAPATDDVRREARDLVGNPLPPPEPSAAPPSRRRWVLGGVATALVVGGGAIALVVASGPDDVLPENPYEPMLDQAALDRFADDLEEATGSTHVLHFGAYGVDDMTATVPPATPDGLADVYRWDGTTFEKWQSQKEYAEREPFDLRDIDPAAVVAADEQAREDSGDEIFDSRVTIEKPLDADGEWIRIFVTETDQETWVVRAELDGDVTDSGPLG